MYNILHLYVKQFAYAIDVSKASGWLTTDFTELR